MERTHIVEGRKVGKRKGSKIVDTQNNVERKKAKGTKERTRMGNGRDKRN